MLSPEFLEHIPDSMMELYSQAEQDILKDIARRLSTYNYWISSAEWQVKKLEAMGMVRDEILKQLEQMTSISKKELKRLMEKACVTTLKSDDEVYRRAGLSPLPLQADAAMLQVLEAGWRKTNKQFANLTNTTANTATKQFEDALDRAHLMITSGAFDQNTAVRLTIKDLAKQGVKSITYPTGHTDTLEVAVLRATRTGVNQTCAMLQKARAAEMECDLVEVTAHAGARPSHAEWQGRIYSWSGQSDTYPPFEESTGYGTGAGLCGWNCRHSFYPFFDGISQPVYTQEALQEMEAKNYKYNGHKMTEYEATQKQRYIERQIRRWKRENLAMNAAGFDTGESAAKLKHWQDTQKDFLEQTGLKRQSGREQIGGFGKSEAQKVIQSNKKAVKEYVQQHISSVERSNSLNNTENSGIINTNAKRFASRTEADKMFRPWTEEAWQRLSPEEKLGAYRYTCGSKPFNRPLRGYDGSWDNFVGVGKVPLDNEGAGQLILDLKNGINKVELKEDVWLFRGSDQQSLAGLLGIDKDKIIPSKVEALNRKFTGKPIKDEAFFSTGITADSGFHDKISYEILAPRGTKGIYAEPFSRYGGTNSTGDWNGKEKLSSVELEAEVILQAGTSFEVKEIKLVSDKITVVLKVILD